MTDDQKSRSFALTVASYSIIYLNMYQRTTPYCWQLVLVHAQKLQSLQNRNQERYMNNEWLLAIWGKCVKNNTTVATNKKDSI